jgi:hypothetical protein
MSGRPEKLPELETPPEAEAGPLANGQAGPIASDPVAAFVAELAAAPAEARLGLWETHRVEIAAALASRGVIARKRVAKRLAETLDATTSDVLQELSTAGPPAADEPDAEMDEWAGEEKPAGAGRPSGVRLPEQIEALLQRLASGEAWDDVQAALVEHVAALGLTVLHIDEIGARVGPLIGKPPRRVASALRTSLEDAGKSPGGRVGRDELDAIMRAAEERGELERCHDPSGKPWIVLRRGARREAWPARSDAVKSWLRRVFYEKTRGAPKPDELAEAVGLLAARAEFESPTAEIAVRKAERNGRIFIDLADADGRAVEIGPDGWQVVTEPPVLFYRVPGTAPLPEPVRGDPAVVFARLGEIFGLDRTQCVLAFGWCLAAVKPNIPYPVLVVSAEAGAGKTAFSGFLASLIDPRSPQLLSPPENERDLAIAAQRRAVVAVENVSRIPNEMSDAFCRLATTGGFATRKLYTDDDEAVFDARRPILFNGIGDVVRQDDLIDRSIVVTLRALEDEQRRTLADLEHELDGLRPGLFGALCDAIATGLRRLPGMPARGWPRMADAAQWVEACWPALGPSGEFLAAYSNNRAEAAKDVADADPISRTLIASFDKLAPSGRLERSAEALLAALASEAGVDLAKRPEDWPRTGRGLAARLVRLAPALRRIADLSIARGSTGRGRDKSRVLVITRTSPGAGGRVAAQSSPPSPSSPPSLPAAISPCSSMGWRGDDWGRLGTVEGSQSSPSAGNRPHFPSPPSEWGRSGDDWGRLGTVEGSQSSPLDDTKRPAVSMAWPDPTGCGDDGDGGDDCAATLPPPDGMFGDATSVSPPDETRGYL